MPLGIELLCYMKLMDRKVPKAFLLYNARYAFMEGDCNGTSERSKI